MKRFFAKKAMPAIAVMAAVMGAFAFERAEDTALIPETGWINLPGKPCEVPVNCDFRPSGPVCTASYQGTTHQAFGKNDPAVNICAKTLRMPLN